MTAVDPDATVAVLLAAAGTPAARLPAVRGETTIAPRVLSKIAGRAAGEVDGVENRSPSGLSRLLPSPQARPASAEARLDGQTARVSLTLAVRYPRPVWETVQRVERHVRGRLAALAGISQVNFDIEVAELPLARTAAHRVS